MRAPVETFDDAARTRSHSDAGPQVTPSLVKIAQDPELAREVETLLRRGGVELPSAGAQVRVTVGPSDGKSLEAEDVKAVFSRLGPIKELAQAKHCWLVTFKSLLSAYLAVATLNGRTLAGVADEIIVEWATQQPSETTSETASNGSGSGKLTRRYAVQITNNKRFPVS